MTFDTSEFNRHLTTDIFGRSLLTFDRLPSTNKTLWQYVNQGTPIGTVVIAEQQTKGRGQWGRTWISEKGGMYLSVAIAPKLNAHLSAHLTLASAWGVAKQLREHFVPVQLKWPNDLYLNQLKLGGILTETVIQQEGIQRAVIGIGLNWSNPVPATAITLKTSPFAQEHTIQSLEQLAAIAVNGLEQGCLVLQNSGLEAIMPTYLSWLTGKPPEILEFPFT